MGFPRRFSFFVFVSVAILIAAPAVFASSVPPATAARTVAKPGPNVRVASSVVYEQDPSTGTVTDCWQNAPNRSPYISYADRATLANDTLVTAISIWSCTPDAGTTARVEIFADNAGVPGALLYSEDTTPSVVADGAYYKYTVQLATPFFAHAGTRYWYGLPSASNTDDIGLIGIKSPDDGQMAELIHESYDHMNSGVGDQAFELVGHAPTTVPAVGLSGLVALALLLALGGVLALKR